jgi:hypothetical protein
MKRVEDKIRVGLRDKVTGKPVIAYPEPVDENSDEVSDKVFFWYYQQSCAAEDKMRKYYVDVLTDQEIKLLSH